MRRTTKRWAFFHVTTIVLGLCATSYAGDDDRKVAAGHALAENRCARCHAIGLEGTSPSPGAPPFRTLHDHYPVESLAEALAEGIVVGHREMPKFALSPDQVDQFIAYLKSLEPPT